QAILGDGERLQRVELPEEAGEPVMVMAAKPGEGRPQRLTVYLDPPSAQVLATARSGEGVFQVLHVLHGSLMIPGVGRQIVGWIGVAMLVSSISGLWLWWPLTGSVRRGLRWKRQPNFDTNLHHQFGFWISMPLFVLSLTGVWISFPKAFAGFESAPAQRGPGGAGGPGARRALPLAVAPELVAPTVALAEQAAGGKAVSLSWPTDQKAQWTVRVAQGTGAEAEVTVAAEDLATRVEADRGEP